MAAVVTGDPAPFVLAGPFAPELRGLLERRPGAAPGRRLARALLRDLAATGAPAPGRRVAVPASWTAGELNGSPQHRDPATGRTVRVSTTDAGEGGADAVRDRRDQAASFTAGNDE